LKSFDQQIWLDDDCYLKEGSIEALKEGLKHRPHLLHLKPWAHIKLIGAAGPGIAQFTGATACMMAFDRSVYRQIPGFYAGHGIYGGWHHELSLKLVDGYYALENSTDYIHSFDLDGVPSDFDYHFQSSLPQHERIKK
jgi:hypothetical protein